MADESAQERTEAPTPRRLQQASEDGQVARSQELATAALMIGAATSLVVAAPAAGRLLLRLFGDSLANIGDGTGSAAGIRLLLHSGWTTLLAVAMLCAATAAAALAAGALQARGTFTSKPLEMKWSRVDPLANGKNLLSMRAPVDLLKALLKILIIAAVAWTVLRGAWPDLVDLGSRDATSLLGSIRQHGTRLFVVAGISYLGLAAADYAWQLWQHQKQLRMSKEQVKQESKQSEGDPMIKARIRSIARARLRRQMLKDVATADVVIVNPTQRAVALRYDPLAAPAPIVLAMGERKVAERIRQIAKDHGVAIIENRPLAIALIASARVGMVIPAELYVAVAEVLAFVFRQRALRGRAPAWARGEVQ